MAASNTGQISIPEVDALLSGATPQFAMQLKARLFDMVSKLDASDSTRQYAEKQMEMLDRLAGSTTRSIVSESH